MHVTRNRLTRWLALVLSLVGLVLCGISTGLAAEKRTWKGKNGSSFEGHFLTVDERTGNYVFMDIHGEFVHIEPNNLTDESRRWVAEQLKAEGEDSGSNKRPLLAPVRDLVFTKPAACARDWTNLKGQTVTGAILSATRDVVKLEVRGKPATVPLKDLREEDRAAALLWTGTTNDPLSFSGGTFDYGVTCGGDEVLGFSIELSSSLSRITLEHTEVVTGITPSREKIEVVTEMKKRLVTDHATGAYQITQWTKGKGWRKTAIGRWNPRSHREASAPTPHRADWLRGALPEMEVTTVGPWIARRLVLKNRSASPPLFNQWIESNPLALVCFADSNLPAALRLVLESPGVVGTSPPDPSLAAPKPRRVLPTAVSVVRFPPLDDMLGALQAHELAPVAWSFEVSKDRAGKHLKAGRYVVALKRFDWNLPDASDFEIDPEAASMKEGSYKDLRPRR